MTFEPIVTNAVHALAEERGISIADLPLIRGQWEERYGSGKCPLRITKVDIRWFWGTGFISGWDHRNYSLIRSHFPSRFWDGFTSPGVT